jgi:hypothetical protein
MKSRYKIAVASYHTFYVDNCDSVSDATDIVIDKLRSVADSDASDSMSLADCETTVDYAVCLD